MCPGYNHCSWPRWEYIIRTWSWINCIKIRFQFWWRNNQNNSVSCICKLHLGVKRPAPPWKCQDSMQNSLMSHRIFFIFFFLTETDWFSHYLGRIGRECILPLNSGVGKSAIFSVRLDGQSPNNYFAYKWGAPAADLPSGGDLLPFAPFNGGTIGPGNYGESVNHSPWTG